MHNSQQVLSSKLLFTLHLLLCIHLNHALTSGSNDASDENPYHEPDQLSVIRLNDKSVVLRWEIAQDHITTDSLKYFKAQYKSTKKPNDTWITDSRDIPPSVKAVQIDRLKPGNYNFVVVAVYDNDDSRQSRPFKYRLKSSSKIPTHELPNQEAPRIFWSQAFPDQIRFRWNYTISERDLSSGVFGFMVYYKSAYSISDWSIYITTDESVEIAELEPETLYEAKVLAYNEVGVSEFSEVFKLKTLPPKSESSHEQPTVTTTMATVEDELHSVISAAAAAATTTTIPPSINKEYVNKQITGSTVTQAPNDSITKGPMVGSTTTTPTTTTTTTSTTTSAPIIITQITSPRPSIKFEINTSELSWINILTWNDTPVIRYSLCVIILILFILFLMMNCHQRRKEADPSANQPDLEFNGLFQNSFPTSSAHNHHHVPNYYHSYVETA